MQENLVFDKESFFDFLGFMIVHAPDFPEEDFLESNEQLDIDRAFAELSNGIGIVCKLIGEPRLSEMKVLAKRSLDCFREGDELGGIELLQDIDEVVKQLLK